MTRKSLIYFCSECGAEHESIKIEYKCSKCEGVLLIKPDTDFYKEKFTKIKSMNDFWDFSFTFPTIEPDYVISLGEGLTPCKASNKFSEQSGLNNLYFKDETKNPTNSFKDRAAALLISHARSWEFKKAICASNGNQGASIAAYTSLEGMECLNIIPKMIDVGKHAQMIAYNSQIKEVGDIVDDTLEEALKPKYKEYYQCTPEFNPLTIEGQKVISFELIRQLDEIDWIISPMGSGGLLISISKGLMELERAGIIKSMPKLVGVQTEAISPIVDSIEGKESHKSISSLQTQALGILVKHPIYQKMASKTIIETRGCALSVSENDMIKAAKDLAKNEGIFAEPASALTVAVIDELLENHGMDKTDTIVCLITGSGLKAPYVLEALTSRSKTIGGPVGRGSPILSTKLKILNHISLSGSEGINGTELKQIIGSISRSAIYQHLKDLKSKELIERKDKGRNVVYFITKSGKKVLDALEILVDLL